MVSNRKIIKKGVPFIKEPVLENVAVDIQQVEKDQLKKKKSIKAKFSWLYVQVKGSLKQQVFWDVLSLQCVLFIKSKGRTIGKSATGSLEARAE